MAQFGQRRTIEEFSFARRGIDRASTPGRAIRGCAAVAILPGPYSQRKGTLSAVKTLTGVGTDPCLGYRRHSPSLLGNGVSRMLRFPGDARASPRRGMVATDVWHPLF